jgi:hypothetical protein
MHGVLSPPVGEGHVGHDLLDPGDLAAGQEGTVSHRVEAGLFVLLLIPPHHHLHIEVSFIFVVAFPVEAATEYTQSGNDRFLAYILL